MTPRRVPSPSAVFESSITLALPVVNPRKISSRPSPPSSASVASRLLPNDCATPSLRMRSTRGSGWPPLPKAIASSSPGAARRSTNCSALCDATSLTLLYGVSGLGKTSLLQAGLFPALRAEDCLPVPIRLDYLEGAAPLAAQVLGAIIAAADAARVEAPRPRPDETLWEYLHREGNHFWSPRNDLVTPFLAFDQFEELFTLGRETPECATRTTAFISELADLVENRPPAALRDDPLRAKEFSFKPAPLKVLLAMREDYLADLDRIRSHFRALGQNRLRLLPMGERQARQVIALGAPLLAPGVEDRILKFVAGGDDDAAEITIAPALLSLVLRELNERRLARGPDAKITPDLLDVEQRKIFEDFYLRTTSGLSCGRANLYRGRASHDDRLSRQLRPR